MQPHMENPALAGTGLPKSDQLAGSITSEFNSPLTDIQAADALARRVFGHGFLVAREPITTRFRPRAPSRIRSWRAPNV